jgi:hypothetical protein
MTLEGVADAVRADQFIDLVMAATLITVSAAVIIAFNLLRRQLNSSVTELTQLFRSQSEMEKRMERIWKRIDDIEMRQGMRGDVEEFSRIRRFFDALDAASGPENEKKDR